MSKVFFRKVTVNRDDWQEEFDRGMREWNKWVTSESARANVARRKAQTSDELEKAFFFGVLTGAKRAGVEFPSPKNWKGQPTGMTQRKENPLVVPEGWTPRMVRRV